MPKPEAITTNGFTMKKSVLKTAIRCTALMAVAGVVTALGLFDRNTGLAKTSDATFTGAMLCTWGRCLEDNSRFIAFLEANLGQTAMFDFEIDIPFGAGEFQAECYGKLVHSHPHDGDDSLIIAVLPNFDDCFPSGAVFLQVAAENITHVTAVTGSYTDRISGYYTVILGSYDAAPLYTLDKSSG